MSYEQQARSAQVRAHETVSPNELSAALPDLYRALAWHTDLCGLSEKVLTEYVEFARQAAQQCHDPRKTHNG